MPLESIAGPGGRVRGYVSGGPNDGAGAELRGVAPGTPAEGGVQMPRLADRDHQISPIVQQDEEGAVNILQVI